MIRYRVYATVAMLAFVFLAAGFPNAGIRTTKGAEMIRIEVIAGDTVLPATLDDTPAGRDFASLLPLELTLSDYNGVEKTADLPRKLDTTDAPASYKPKKGDITQYVPWSNIAIFTKPFSDSRGLLRLGEFDGPIDALTQAGEVTVQIRLAD
ncbi:UNVERIFIED_ORG: hypothetical protein BCL66_102140 [Martelella mediterranea]